MSQAITIFGATKAQFTRQVQQALTDANGGQPVKKQAIIRKAVATILNQKNQHLPAAKFADDKATLEEQLTQLLSGFDFLHQHSINDGRIEYDFSYAAPSTNAKSSNITIDYRVCFDINEREAYFTIGKNFDDGVDKTIEFKFDETPDVNQLIVEKSECIDSFAGPDEVLIGFSDMLAIYLAIANNELLREVFLPQEQRFLPALTEKNSTPKVNAKDVGDKLAVMAKERAGKGNDVNTADLVAGAATAFSMLGSQYEHIPGLLAFVHMTGDVDKLIDKKVYVVYQGYNEDGFFDAKLLRSYKKSEKNSSTPTEIEKNFDEDNEIDWTIRHVDEQIMKERFAWNTYANKPVTADDEGMLIPL